MRKQVFGRHFKRDTNERQALFKGLMSSLILSERMQTTEEKAKAIKGTVEKLVTKVKKNGAKAKNNLYKDLTPAAIEKLIADVAPRFVNRAGGYTRILRLGKRVKDNAQMVLIEWTEKAIIKEELKTNTKEEKRNSKKVEEKKEKKIPAKKPVKQLKPVKSVKKEKK